MFKNYFKIAFRNLVKDRSYSLINILGLALGITSCLFIFLYVQNELSYDDYHTKSDRIFRVAQEANGRQGFSWVGSGMVNDLEKEFSNIEQTVRIHRASSLVSYNDEVNNINKSFRESRFVFSDPNIFDVFTIPLIEGNKGSVLSDLGNVVISEEIGTKYFGDNDPLGKTLVLENNLSLTVTGVFETLPENTHLAIDLISSYTTLKSFYGYPTNQDFTSYWWPIAWNYIVLNEGADPQAIQSEMEDFSSRYRDADEVSTYDFILQPLSEIYLHSKLSDEMKAGGNINTIYIFSAIAIIILFIACINFMNLSTARSAKRGLEVGVRKTLGASKQQLIGQFLGESILLTTIAILFSVALIEFSMPFFTHITGKEIAINYLQAPQFWVGLLSITVIIGILAGLYPAFFLSAFTPSSILKGKNTTQSSGSTLRKGLVVFQFGISVILIFGTLVIYQQLNFMQNAELGFETEQTISISTSGIQSNYELVKEELLKEANVVGATGSSVLPGYSAGWSPNYNIEGLQPGETYTMNYQSVDYNFFDQFGIEVIAGRNFSKEYATEAGITTPRDPERGLYTRTEKSFIINESAVKEYGWTLNSAIGKEVELFTEENGTRFLDVKGEIVGVVEDYHTVSLHNKIEPVIYDVAKFNYANGTYSYGVSVMFVKVAPGNASKAMAQLEETWSTIVPDRPFVASYLDERLEALYRSEIQVSNIITLFAILAILIACMGLFGLSSFMAERRLKEIGIRKVFGASIQSLLVLMSMDFVKLVVVGMLISAPIAWYIMDQWLQNFAYHIAMSPMLIIIAGLVALSIALITVSSQSIKASLANPVKTLRSE